MLNGLTARKVAQVTIGAVTTCRQDRLDTGAAPSTVNMDITVLSTMFNWAVKHRIIGSNPLVGVKPLPVDEKCKDRRPLSIEEFEAIFEHSPEHLKHVWRVYVTTGIRHDDECVR